MTNVDNINNNLIIDNPAETNIFNNYQGNFRKTILDLDLLSYAINKDEYIKNYQDKEMYITCLDLMKSPCFTYNKRTYIFSSTIDFMIAISDVLKIKNVIPVASPDFI